MKGLGVSPGIGIGKAFVINEKSIDIAKVYINDTKREIARLRNAFEIGRSELDKLYVKTLNEVGKKEAQIFKSHEMMLEDNTFISEIESKIINENVSAEYSLKEISGYYISLFDNIKDEYLKGRSEDIRDVMLRVVKILLGVKTVDYSKLNKNSVLVVKNLTSSDTAQIEKESVAAIITEIGGKTSHAAIISRMLGIPTVIGIDNIVQKIKDDDIVICDGKSGKVLINPNKKQLLYYIQKKARLEEINNGLKKQIGLSTTTKDGFKVSLSANIGTPHDVDMVLKNDAEGIGLFRSEFIFMNRSCQPSEDEQFEEYREVLQKMGDKSVIIRTLDIGGDKNVSYFDIPKEANPFLGYRAIRLCLGNVDIFRTQLRAILKASVYGNLKIMFPMISTMKELRDTKKILERAKQELVQEGIPFSDNIEIGIMIEVPSAAIISDLLAKEVDFFSIGTNDLIQYTMAVDRMNSKLSYLYSQYHPALLRLVKGIIENGHKSGIKVGMCGEAAGDPKLIPVFLGMGLDEFSINSSSILSSRYIIRNLNMHEMKKIADNTLNMETAVEVENYLSSLFSDESESYLKKRKRKRKINE
jgi:phosphotransferase system enzyme I (PtsI)